MTRDDLMQQPIGELRKLKNLLDDVLADRAHEAKQIFAERVAALRAELGMPERAPIKRRKKKAHRDSDGDKTAANGAST
jgi:hypothetical protein